MTREAAMQRLTVVWLVLPLPAAGLLAVQTIAGKYGEDGNEAWSWLLGQFAPIVALILAAAFSAPSRSWKQKAANKFRWYCALGTSVFYGLLLLALLLLEPLLSTSPYELFGSTGWLLALLQGVVVACVGAVVFDGR